MQNYFFISTRILGLKFDTKFVLKTINTNFEQTHTQIRFFVCL